MAKKIAAAVVAIAFSALLLGCEEGPGEKAGKQLDKLGRDAKEQAGSLIDKLSK